MEGENITVRPPPSGPVLATASSVSPGSQMELKDQASMSVCYYSCSFLRSSDCSISHL